MNYHRKTVLSFVVSLCLLAMVLVLTILIS